MTVLDRIFEEARQAPRHIVLAEGADERVKAAAAKASSLGIARLTLLCDSLPDRPDFAPHDPRSAIEVVDPVNSSCLEGYADTYARIRAHKGVSEESALIAMKDPLGFAAMMVRTGDADGAIAGAVSTTAAVIRASLQIIGKAPEARMVSSFFLMIPGAHHLFRGAVVFADCALAVDPDPEELADIAVASAMSAQSMLGEDPRVVLLSFSTAGSSGHELAERVNKAVSIARRVRPDFEIEGEMQFDAAIDPGIRERKAPDSRMAAMPNVFVFPNLSAANIGYKIAERVGGMTAVGPVLQGLAKPANDLSRGCSVNDILNLIAITSVQARESGGMSTRQTGTH